MTNYESLVNLNEWIKLIKKHCLSSAKKPTSPVESAENETISFEFLPPTIIIGNKIDLLHSRVVKLEDVDTFCEPHKLKHCQISAATGEGIEKLFGLLRTLSVPLNSGFNGSDENGNTLNGLEASRVTYTRCFSA